MRSLIPVVNSLYYSNLYLIVRFKHVLRMYCNTCSSWPISLIGWQDVRSGLLTSVNNKNLAFGLHEINHVGIEKTVYWWSVTHSAKLILRVRCRSMGGGGCNFSVDICMQVKNNCSQLGID